MELEERIQRGIRAQEVLKNDLYIEAYAQLKTEINLQWQQSPARDSDGREKLYLMTGLIDKLQSIMQTVMETGILAQKDLEHNRTMLEKAKAYLR